LGFVEDVASTISSKKYFISPTYIGSGLRIKVLNALSGGAVCFLTPLDASMLSNFVDGENIIKFSDFKEFYEKLIKVETSDVLYNSISLHAKTAGTNFTWEDYAVKVKNELSNK
jgi:hypothetical protein